tara:strand:+ start:14588 stop:14779 length:192 start_codon:yes stop_codon:yes gene_type:complete
MMSGSYHRRETKHLKAFRLSGYAEATLYTWRSTPVAKVAQAFYHLVKNKTGSVHIIVQQERQR